MLNPFVKIRLDKNMYNNMKKLMLFLPFYS